MTARGSAGSPQRLWNRHPGDSLKAALLLGLVVCLSVATRTGAATRVVMMDFATDDNSYRSAQEAANFTSLVQADLAREPQVDWVERAQLAKARHELELSAAELVGGSLAIQRGKWLKADWMISGEFSADDKNQRTLTLEILDLQHADVLASKTITLAGAVTPQFQIAPNQTAEVSGALRALLSTARTRQQQLAGTVLVASFFLVEVPAPLPLPA